MAPKLKELEMQHPEWCWNCGKYWLEAGGIHTCHSNPLLAALTAAKLEDEATIHEKDARIAALIGERDSLHAALKESRASNQRLADQRDEIGRRRAEQNTEESAHHNRVKASLHAQLSAEQAAHAATKEELRKVDEVRANLRLHNDHLQAQFQRETLRTSELYQMLVKWMKRNADKGCSAEPWAKDECADCTLMRETKELLERPINIAKDQAQRAADAAKEEGA